MLKIWESRLPDRLTTFARELRQRQTDVERKLWSKLRDRRLVGLRFRRQHPIGPYVVDFVCEDAKVVVELDGSQHKEPANVDKDAARTSYLETRGYHVLRIWNTDVNTNIDGVLSGIYSTASARIKPSPSSALRAPSPVPGEGQ